MTKIISVAGLYVAAGFARRSWRGSGRSSHGEAPRRQIQSHLERRKVNVRKRQHAECVLFHCANDEKIVAKTHRAGMGFGTVRRKHVQQAPDSRTEFV